MRSFWTVSVSTMFVAALQISTAQCQSIVDEWTLDTNQHIFSIAISPDGKTLAAGNDNIHLYDLTGAEPRAKTVIQSRMFVGVRGLVFSPDSKRIAYGGSDHIVHVWSVGDEPKELSVGKSHADDVLALSFSPDGRVLASGSSDRTVILWNVGESGKLTENLVIKRDERFDAGIRSVAFTSQNSLISVNGQGAVRMIVLTKDGKYQVAKENRIPGLGSDPNIAVRVDGKTFAVSADKSIGISGGVQGVYIGHTRRVTGLSFSPDGSTLASCGADGRLNLFVGTAKGPKLSRERPDTFTAISFTPPTPENRAPAEAHLAVGTDKGKVFVYKVALPKKK